MTQATIRVPEWMRDEAEERDLSLSEFARRMIRAGERQFGYDYTPQEVPAEPKSLKIKSESKSLDINKELKQWIEANLSTDEAYDVDDLIELLRDDIIELADELCEEGRAKYRRGEGGYLKVVDDE